MVLPQKHAKQGDVKPIPYFKPSRIRNPDSTKIPATGTKSPARIAPKGNQPVRKKR